MLGRMLPCCLAAYCWPKATAVEASTSTACEHLGALQSKECFAQKSRALLQKSHRSLAEQGTPAAFVLSAVSPEERLERLKPISWVHVPKTGSTFAEVLFGHSKICPFMPEEDFPIPAVWRPWLDGHDFGALCPGSFGTMYPGWPGHSGFGAAYAANAGHAVIFLRQPEQRLISGYHHRMHGWFRAAPPQDLREYAEVMAGMSVRMLTRSGDFEMARQIPCMYCVEPVTKDAAALAVQRLRDGFPFVGITDEWALSVCLFHAMFGGPCHLRELGNTRPGNSRNGTEPYDTAELRGFVDVYDRAVWEEGLRIFRHNLKLYGVTDASCAKMCPSSPSTVLLSTSPSSSGGKMAETRVVVLGSFALTEVATVQRSLWVVAPAAVAILGAIAAVLAWLGEVSAPGLSSISSSSSCSSTPSLWSLQVLFLLYTVVVLARCSVMIPQSFALAKELGYGAGVSGFIMGSSYLFSVVGASVSRRYFIQQWDQPRNRLVVTLASLGFVVSDILCSCAAEPLPSWGLSAGARFCLLMAGRSSIGVMVGFTLLLQRVMVFKVTPNSKGMLLAMSRMCAMALGTGMGPFIPWLVYQVSSGSSDMQMLSKSCWAIAAVSLGLSFMWYRFCPMDLEPMVREKEKQDELEQPTSNQINCTPDVCSEAAQARSVIVLSTIAVFAVQGVAVSGLEAGSSLILELQFSFSTQSIGLAIGATFSTGLPLLFILSYLRSCKVTPDHVIAQSLTIAALLACFLFHTQVSEALVGRMQSWWSILIADGAIFSSLYMSGGILDGFAVRYALPGSMYSSANYIFMNQLVGTSCRCIGPPVARLVIAQGGRNAYMTLQASMCCAIVMLAFTVSRQVAYLESISK